MDEFLQFWGACGVGQRVHPADKAILDRVGHKFDLTCLPAPFTGPLLSARVVLLFLAPGLAADGYDAEHAKSDKGQLWYHNQLSGEAHLPTKQQHKTHEKWLAPRIKQLGLQIDSVRDKVAVLDLAPYHSKQFKDHSCLSALPSCRAAVDFAQRHLLPEARKGNIVVVCLRSPTWWGLQRDSVEEVALLSPRVSRGGYMHHSSIRQRVVRTIKSALEV